MLPQVSHPLLRFLVLQTVSQLKTVITNCEINLFASLCSSSSFSVQYKAPVGVIVICVFKPLRWRPLDNHTLTKNSGLGGNRSHQDVSTDLTGPEMIVIMTPFEEVRRFVARMPPADSTTGLVCYPRSFSALGYQRAEILPVQRPPTLAVGTRCMMRLTRILIFRFFLSASWIRCL
jgi:hypothetical protein